MWTGYGDPMTIDEFLLARVAEDEAGARDVLNRVSPGTAPLANSVRFYASRVLAECAVKRRIVDLHKALGFDDAPGRFYCDHDQRTAGVYPCATVRVVAAVYADHRDYDESWRP